MYQTPQSQSWYWFNAQRDIEEKYYKVCMVVHELSEVIKHIEQKIIEIEKPSKKIQRKCKFYDSGFCKRRENCRFEHPKSLCQTFLETVNCQYPRTCPHRHPRVCRECKVGNVLEEKVACIYIHRLNMRILLSMKWLLMK